MKPRYSYIIHILLLICLVVLPCAYAGDYLIIKKKSGAEQRVPLEFSPEQIESFQVEQGKKSQDESETPTPEPTREPAGPSKKSVEEAKSGDSSAPMIFKKPPAGQPVGPRSKPAQPAADDDVDEAGGQPEPAPKAEGPHVAPRKPASGPVSISGPAQKGQFSVNVYRFPENTRDNIRALPDFSAMRPASSVTCDRVNLEPDKGDNEPALQEKTADGLGFRFVGVFMVSGEGIFKWRVYSKDGARLSIDDKTVIENDGIHEASSKTGYVHLGEGVHTVLLDSFNSKGSPALKLYVEPPIGSEQIFSLGQGLAGWKEPAKPYDVLWGQVYFVPKGTYPEGPDFNQLSPIGRIIAPELNVVSGEEIQGIPGRKDMLGVRYQGFFKVDGTGIFAFRMLADNFARLTINKQNIVDVIGGGKNEPNGKLGWAFLQQGSYPITVDYFHAQGPQKLELYVTTPIKDEELLNPSRTLEGFSSDSGKMNLIPAFVYFLKPNTRKLPAFNKMSPSGMFFAKTIDFAANRGTNEFPGVPKRDQWLGLRFYAKINIDQSEAGNYKFRLVCNDSAKLIVAKKPVITIENPPGRVSEQSGSVDLTPGTIELFLDYLQTTGPNCLQLYITAPGSTEKLFSFQ